MKTAGRENPNRWANRAQEPSTWRGRSEQILLKQVGCEARKTPAVGVVFFLDFSLALLEDAQNSTSKTTSSLPCAIVSVALLQCGVCVWGT
jgi:hypothetical protein